MTRVDLVAGCLTDGEELRVRARSDLVVSGDGMESDRLLIGWGQELVLRRSSRALRLLLLPECRDSLPVAHPTNLCYCIR